MRFVLSARSCSDLSENAEIHAAVSTVFHEVFVRGEIILLAVLEDKNAILVEQLMLKYEVWERWQLFQRVRRVGKNEIERLVAGFHETEDIAFDEDA